MKEQFFPGMGGVFWFLLLRDPVLTMKIGEEVMYSEGRRHRFILGKDDRGGSSSGGGIGIHKWVQ